MRVRPVPSAAVAFAVGLSLGIVAGQTDHPPADPPPAHATETLSVEPGHGLMGSSNTSLMKPIAYRIGDATHKITGKSCDTAKVVILPLHVNSTPVTLMYEVVPNRAD
jgi:hypothetical protein